MCVEGGSKFISYFTEELKSFLSINLSIQPELVEKDYVKSLSTWELKEISALHSALDSLLTNHAEGKV